MHYPNAATPGSAPSGYGRIPRTLPFGLSIPVAGDSRTRAAIFERADSTTHTVSLIWTVAGLPDLDLADAGRSGKAPVNAVSVQDRTWSAGRSRRSL